MTKDLESQRQPLVDNNKNMPKWEKISKIIENDDQGALQLQLEQESVELVLRPKDSQHHKTALHAAVESSAMECLRTLLKANPLQEILDSPDTDGNTPLHVAVKTLNSKALEMLLAAGAYPNVRNDQGFTALHILGYASKTAKTTDNLTAVIQSTDVLLRQDQIDIEALNNSNLTPLKAAAGLFPCNVSSLEQFCKKLINKGAIIEQKTQKILDEHCIPKIIPPAGIQKGPRPALSVIFDLIITNKIENISAIIQRQTKEEARNIANQYVGSKKILYYLVDKSNEEGVKILLTAAADPWSCDMNGELPLHRALARGQFPIVDCLIDKMKRGNKNSKVDLRYKSFTLLQKVLESQASRNQSMQEFDSIKCLRRLFQNDVLLNVNQKEDGSINQTALHVAAAMNNQDAMAILLENGSYIGEHRIIGNQDNGTVFNALLSKTLNKTMDNCIKVPSTTDEKVEDDLLDLDYTLEMNYKFLVQPQSDATTKLSSFSNEVQMLYDISQSKEHRNAIKHPLIQTLLYAKWRKVYPLYLLNLFIYLVFVLLLTTFLYTLKNLRILERMEITGNVTDPAALQSQIYDYQTTRGCILVVVLLITIYMTVKEVFQIIFTYKSYFFYVENYLEWFLIVAVLVAAFVPLSVDATRHLAAWAMIVAWYEFVLVLGKLPSLEIYITMLRHVSWNFLKLISLFGFLIIAFSISFNIILQPSGDLQTGTDFNDFSAFWTTVPRAIVMATGEFEYSSISEELSSNAVYATSTVLIFLVFLFLIFLVLMNVMTGLAVTDAKEIMEDAILYSLKSRLELVYLNEQLCFKVRYLHKLLPRLQLLDNKEHRMLVKINKRVIYEDETQQKMCKLDRRTADVVRNHRLHQLAEARAESEVSPTDQILKLLHEMNSKTMAPGSI